MKWFSNPSMLWFCNPIISITCLKNHIILKAKSYNEAQIWHFWKMHFFPQLIYHNQDMRWEWKKITELGWYTDWTNQRTNQHCTNINVEQKFEKFKILEKIHIMMTQKNVHHYQILNNNLWTGKRENFSYLHCNKSIK